jgi:4-hydroxy-2-oxoheptanedioate aldolase
MANLPGFSLGRRLAAGETVYTGWCALPAPIVAESIAREGFVAVTIDQQHGLWDTAATVAGIAAIRMGGAAPIVRIPLGTFAVASRALDFGAEGIIAPMINSVADAKAFVNAAKYPPLGERSWGPTRAMTLAGIADPRQYLNEANGAVVAIAMIETKIAMANLDAIAAMAGIDVLFVGPSDLSIGLTDGNELDPHSATVEAGLDKIVAACRKARKIAGLYCANAERAVACAKRGIRFLAVGSDLGFLRAGTAAQLKVLKG